MSEPKPPDSVQKFIDDMLSNRSPAAMARDAEADVAAHGPGPVDLRSIPKDQWDRFIDFDVTLPPAVQTYLADYPVGQPLTTEEVQNMEIAVEQWHGVSEPYYIAMSLTLQQSGKPWAYVQSDKFTGFTFGKET